MCSGGMVDGEYVDILTMHLMAREDRPIVTCVDCHEVMSFKAELSMRQAMHFAHPRKKGNEKECSLRSDADGYFGKMRYVTPDDARRGRILRASLFDEKNLLKAFFAMQNICGSTEGHNAPKRLDIDEFKRVLRILCASPIWGYKGMERWSAVMLAASLVSFDRVYGDPDGVNWTKKYKYRVEKIGSDKFDINHVTLNRTLVAGSRRPDPPGKRPDSAGGGYLKPDVMLDIVLAKYIRELAIINQSDAQYESIVDLSRKMTNSIDLKTKSIRRGNPLMEVNDQLFLAAPSIYEVAGGGRSM